MADTQPNIPDEERDEEYERIRAITPGLQDESKDEEAQANEEEAPKPEDEAPAADAEEKDEEPAADAPPATSEEDQPEDPQGKKRPERYIPIDKYTAEKNKWRDEKAQLEADLTAANAAKGQAKDDKVKAFAEEHGIPEDEVRELMKLEDTGTKEADEELHQRLQQADVVLAEKAYETEFNQLAVPELKKAYPDATPEQLQAAKKEIEKIACTEEFLDKPLDYVVFKKAEELAKLFSTQVQRKGPEHTRQAPAHGNADYTADDFKDGKTSFAELSALPVEKQTAIIEGMDYKTYDAFERYVERNATSTINRGGKKIEY